MLLLNHARIKGDESSSALFNQNFRHSVHGSMQFQEIDHTGSVHCSSADQQQHMVLTTHCSRSSPSFRICTPPPEMTRSPPPRFLLSFSGSVSFVEGGGGKEGQTTFVSLALTPLLGGGLLFIAGRKSCFQSREMAVVKMISRSKKRGASRATPPRFCA